MRGSTGGAGRWCSRWCRAARGSSGRRSRPATPVSMVNRACSAISLPWSQVSDRISCAGSVVIAAARASATARRCPSGSPTSIRSGWGARPAWRPGSSRVPKTRSPSQCPGTARSAASAGRSVMFRMFGRRPARRAAERPSGGAWPARCAGAGSAPCAGRRGPARTATGRSSRATPASCPGRGTRRRSHPAICCGDQRSTSLSSTIARNPGRRASFVGFGRPPAPTPPGPARAARYRRRPPLPATSRRHRRRRPTQPGSDRPQRLPAASPGRSPPARPARAAAPTGAAALAGFHRSA